MRRIVLLIATVLICFSPVAYAIQDEEEEVEPFTWDEKYIEQLQKVNVPVYIPSYVASPEFSRILGHLFISKIEVSKDHYSFRISRQRVREGKPKTLLFDVMTMSVGALPADRKQPF